MAKVFDGLSVSIEDIVAVGRHGERVRIAGNVGEILARSRGVIDKALTSKKPVYGLNTGVGTLTGKEINDEDIRAFNHQVINSHAAPIFENELPVDRIRAIIAARINSLLRGAQGVRPELVNLLVEMLNRGVNPVVHARGVSLGESDLSPMAEIALVVIGQGTAQYRGKTASGAQTLKLAGLEPLDLEANEGLALISSNALTTGSGCLALYEARQVLDAFDVSAALSLEGYAANLGVLDDVIAQARPLAGQIKRTESVRALLENSILFEDGQARKLQDPFSFRCIPQLHGMCEDALVHAENHLEQILNAAVANPLVVAEEERLVSNGNFESTGIALVFDQLRLALQRLIVLSTQRVAKQLDGAFSDLPDALADPDDREILMFYNNLSRVMSALAGEAYACAFPASLSYTPQFTQGTDDFASMAPLSVEKTLEILRIARAVIALELLVATRASELRGLKRMGRSTSAVMSGVMDLKESMTLEGKTDLAEFINDLTPEKIMTLARGKTGAAVNIGL